MTLLQRLRSLPAPIRVAVIGTGQMGTGVVRHAARVPGLRVAGLCDLVAERAMAAAAEAGLAVEASPGAGVSAAIERGRAAVTTAWEALVEAPQVDVVVDATGAPELGARLALRAIEHRKTVVTMNIEAEATVGPLLASLAREAGVVYTVAGGDEPAVLAELVEAVRLMGLEVVCAGKGKNNPLDPSATPRTVAAEARARGMSPRMLAAFVDGTKTMAEMTTLANAAGLTVDRPGMHGPRADLADLLRTLVPVRDGGLLAREGVVEYTIGDVAPGVFVVARSHDPAVRRDLAYLRMGAGPYYLLARPFHLASLEVPRSIARAVLYREVTMAAAGPPRVECAAAAKRDLRAGERLDGIGGETVYGVAVDAAEARRSQAVPIGLLEGARLRRPVARGALLTAGDVELDATQTIVALRRRQQEWASREAIAAG
jgi:predicted homoserine dehydrogenase-like protein